MILAVAVAGGLLVLLAALGLIGAALGGQDLVPGWCTALFGTGLALILVALLTELLPDGWPPLLALGTVAAGALLCAGFVLAVAAHYRGQGDE